MRSPSSTTLTPWPAAMLQARRTAGCCRGAEPGVGDNGRRIASFLVSAYQEWWTSCWYRTAPWTAYSSGIFLPPGVYGASCVGVRRCRPQLISTAAMALLVSLSTKRGASVLAYGEAVRTRCRQAAK